MPQPQQPGSHRGPHPLAAVGLATATTLRRRLADMLAMPNTPAPDSRFKYDVLGLGQAMVDYSASVDESLLASFNVEKGGRRVISVQERGEVMATLDEAGCPSSVSPGGSLANSLVAIAKLSRSAGSGLRVAMAGSLGTDTLGEFFNSKMSAAGVSVLLGQREQQHSSSDTTTGASSLGASSSCSGSEASCGSNEASCGASTAHTGTVMVLTTPDAQRSFLSFFTSDGIRLDATTAAAVASSRVVVVEGYLWEMDGAFGYISGVVKAAKAAGAQVVLTAGDPGVVSRHRDEILAVISLGIDIMFTNAEEAAQLVGMPCGHGGSGHGSAAAAAAVADVAAVLGTSVPVAVVTDGSRGSYICADGQVHCIPPHWAPDGPVDTCGAGDAYAAGVLFSVLCGHGVRTAGEFGSRCASAVISKYGPQLSSKDAAALARQLPEPVSPWVARLGLWGNLS